MDPKLPPSKGEPASTADAAAPSDATGSAGSARHDAADASLLDVERRVVRWWQPILALVGLVVIYWLADALGVRSMVLAMRDAVEAAGTEGPLLFVPAYIVLTLLGFPGSWLTLAAGALFGSLVGLVVVVVASNVSAALAFLIARHWLRHRVERWARRSVRFQKLNRMTERHGPAVVLVVRLLNLFPFALVNYGFGVTRVSLRTYLLWSFIGKIPGTVLMVVGVDAIVEALVDRRVPWDLVIVVVAMAVLLAILLRLVHSRFQSEDDED